MVDSLVEVELMALSEGRLPIQAVAEEEEKTS